MGHIMHIQIFGKVGPTNGIGDYAESTGRNHHRHDGKPIKPIREVHGICRTNNDDDREGNEKNAQIYQRILENRQGQLVGQLSRMIGGGPIASDARDHDANQNPHLAGHARAALL